MAGKPHDPEDTDGSAQSGHHTLGPRRSQATPGNHRHIIGDPIEGFISETLFDPSVDIINGSFSGTAVPQLLAILAKYGLEVDASATLPSAQWLWDENTDTTTSPAVGYVRGNAALLENNTELAINRTSQDGKFIPDNTIQSGDSVILVGNTVASVYEVVTATQNADWIYLTVNHTQGSGNPVQDEPITIGLYGGASGHEHPEYLEPSEVLSGGGISVVDNGNGTITVTNIAPGVTDHGQLTGLSDNDHQQYSLTDHTHPVDVAAFWTYKTTHTIVDPGDGFFHTNQASLQQTTKLAISNHTAGDVDISAKVPQLQIGDLITMQKDDNATNFVRYRIVALPVANPTWFEVNVIYEAVGSPDSFTNNATIGIDFHFSSGGGGGGGERGLMVWQGAFNPNITYLPQDMVYYEGALWVYTGQEDGTYGNGPYGSGPYG